MVGAMAGFVAGVVDIGADWMSDLREGVCGHQFWFNKESCCWDSSSQFGQESCDAWLTWSDVLTISKTSKVGYYVFNYFIYILTAFLFSGLTVALVKFFAPYACGSGIPEVSCVILFCV